MLSVQPGEQTIEVQRRVRERHIAKDGTCTKHVHGWMMGQEDQRRAIVDLCAGCTQTYIGIHINDFFIHRALGTSEQCDLNPFCLDIRYEDVSAGSAASSVRSCARKRRLAMLRAILLRRAIRISTSKVARLGSNFTRLGGRSVTFWMRTEKASAKPKNKLARKTPMGWLTPNIAAAMAIQPRPLLMLRVNNFRWPIERNAPPKPASMPLITSARVCRRTALIPTVSAAL